MSRLFDKKAILALLDDQRRVTLPPRLMLDAEAVNELMRGAAVGARTTMVMVRVLLWPFALVTFRP